MNDLVLIFVKKREEFKTKRPANPVFFFFSVLPFLHFPLNVQKNCKAAYLHGTTTLILNNFLIEINIMQNNYCWIFPPTTLPSTHIAFPPCAGWIPGIDVGARIADVG
eukprot:c25304_g1_i1 orf=97-420(+)